MAAPSRAPWQHHHGNGALATAPWQRGREDAVPQGPRGPSSRAGARAQLGKDSAVPGLPGKPRQCQAPASAGVPRGAERSPLGHQVWVRHPPREPRGQKKTNKATPSSAAPHFTRSRELLQTGSCFARCPLHARPSPARPGAAPPAGSDAPRGRGTTNEVAGTGGTDGTGGTPPATAAVLGHSHAPTCAHARAPSTHRAPCLALQLFPALLMPLFPPSQGKPVTFCLLPA